MLAFCVVDGLRSTATNLYTSKIEVRESICAFNDEDLDYISNELFRISAHIGEGYTCEVQYFLAKGCPVAMNGSHAREISKKAAEAVLKDTGLKVYTVPSRPGGAHSQSFVERPLQYPRERFRSPQSICQTSSGEPR